jgi:uncharacterized membrane protein YjdF
VIGLVLVKAFVLGIACASIIIPGLHEFEGEAMTGRIIVYVGATLAVPAIWMIGGRRGPYPLWSDWLLMVPILFDVIGNSFHLYGRVDHYDDVAHLIGLAFAAAFVASLFRSRVGDRLALAGIAVAGGMLIGVGIELVEYALFSHTQATGLSAYTDTIGDLAMDVLGAALAAVLILRLPSRRQSPKGIGSPPV